MGPEGRGLGGIPRLRADDPSRLPPWPVGVTHALRLAGTDPAGDARGRTRGPGGVRGPSDSLATKYRALVRDYQTRQLAFHKSINRAKSDADRRKALTAKPSPAEYAERFLELARADPKDEAGFDALNWVLTYAPHGPESDEALGLLAREHVEQQAARVGPPEAPDLAIAARRGLAPRGARQEPASRGPGAGLLCPGHGPHRQGQAAPGFRPRGRGGRGRDQEEAAPAKPPREEAEALYETLASDYGDVRFVRKKTYADLARTGLARLRPKAGRPETPVRRRR